MENQNNIKPDFTFMPEGTGTKPMKTYTKEEMASLIAGWVDEMMESYGFNQGDISEIYKIFKQKDKKRNNTILTIEDSEFRKYTETLGFFQMDGSVNPMVDVGVQFRKAFFTKLLEKGFTQFILPGRHAYGISRDSKRVDPFMLHGPSYIPTRKSTNVAYLVEPIINGKVIGTALKTIHYNSTTERYEYPEEGVPFEKHTLLFIDPTYAYQLALFQATNMMQEGDEVDFAISAFDINKLYEISGYHITMHTDINAFSVAKLHPIMAPLSLEGGEYFTLVSRNYKIDSLQTSVEAVGAELIDEVLEGYPVGLKPNRLMESFTTNGVKLDIYRYSMVIPNGEVSIGSRPHTDELIISESKRLMEVFEIKDEPHLDALGYNLGGDKSGVVMIFNHIEQNEKFKPIFPLQEIANMVNAAFVKQKNKLEYQYDTERNDFLEMVINNYGVEPSTILEKPMTFEELLDLLPEEFTDGNGVKHYKLLSERFINSYMEDGVLKTMDGDYTEEELLAYLTPTRVALHLSEVIFNESFQAFFTTRVGAKSHKVFVSPNYHVPFNEDDKYPFNPSVLNMLIWDEWGGVNSELPYVNLNEQDEVSRFDRYLMVHGSPYEVFLTSNNHVLLAYAVFPEGTSKEEIANHYKQKIEEGNLFQAFPSNDSKINNYADSFLPTAAIVSCQVDSGLFKHHGVTYVLEDVIGFQEHIFQD